MKNKKTMRWVFVFILITLLLSGCGPGQMFGPTITPTPTQTPIPPTSTPTPVPPTSTSTPTLPPTGTPIPPDENSIIDGMLTCTYRVSTYEHSTARQYLDTGIILKQGENLNIEATGIACFGDSNKDFCNDPKGHPDFTDTDLVGKIGNSGMFHIGTSFQKTINNETGKLYLGFNDTDYENNSGYFDVIIIVENTLSSKCNP